MIPARIKHYLDKHRLRYHVLSHGRTVTLQDAADAHQIKPSQMARAVLIETENARRLVVVLPLNKKIDFDKLQKMVQSDIKILPRTRADSLFVDCEPGAHPPLGEPYRMHTLIDSALLNEPDIYFEPGSHTCVVHLFRDDFNYLMSNATKGLFGVCVEQDDQPSSYWAPQPELRDELQQLHNPCVDAIAGSLIVPTLPPIVHQLLSLSEEHPENAHEALAHLLANNKTCADWIATFDNEDVTRVPDDMMGSDDAFSRLSHMALGYMAGNQFHIPKEGPLGLEAFWRHAVLTATLAKTIATQAARDDCIPQMAFLAGLLHNFGFLLIGHLFPPEFALLNKMRIINPKTSINRLEKRLLGMGHAQRVISCGHAKIGAWLMRQWGMPEPVIAATAHHHDKDYQGDNEIYVHLITLASQLLKAHDLGDGFSEDLTPAETQHFGLSVQEAEQLAQSQLKITTPVAGQQ